MKSPNTFNNRIRFEEEITRKKPRSVLDDESRSATLVPMTSERMVSLSSCRAIVPIGTFSAHHRRRNHLRHFLLDNSNNNNCHDDVGIPEIITDVIPHILSYCDAQTLCRTSCVSRTWHALSSTDEMWERLCKVQFGVSSYEIRPKPEPTKLLYVLTHKQLREVMSTAAAVGSTPPFWGNIGPFTGRQVLDLPTLPFLFLAGFE